MAVVFLIGGTGNQLFEYAASKPHDRFSAVFLHPFTRRMLGWTNHEQTLRYDTAPLWRQIIALTALAIDLPLARMTGLSLFSDIDTRGLKAKPKLGAAARIGYFQNTPQRRSLEPLARQIAPTPEEGVIALHVRGGDLLKAERTGRSIYGLLDRAYYNTGVAHALAALKNAGVPARQLLVLTDDPEYAAALDIQSAGAPPAQILCLPLGETLQRAVGAQWYISSNSTLSYWIVRLRGGDRSIAPQPFQKRTDFDMPTATHRIPINY